MPVVAVLSGIGKVAAAMTTTLLLQQFGVSRVVFTGTAGALSDGLRVGDVVVADGLLQHDMDASPLFPRYEIPLLGTACFRPDPALSSILLAAAAALVRDLHVPTPDGIDAATLRKFGIHDPRVHRGLVVSGDRFIASREERARLRNAIPAAMAVEMEGAALAQVCHAFGAAFAVLRVISDSASDAAQVDFDAFIEEAARRYTLAAVRHCVAALRMASP